MEIGFCLLESVSMKLVPNTCLSQAPGRMRGVCRQHSGGTCSRRTLHGHVTVFEALKSWRVTKGVVEPLPLQRLKVSAVTGCFQLRLRKKRFPDHCALCCWVGGPPKGGGPCFRGSDEERYPIRLQVRQKDFSSSL